MFNEAMTGGFGPSGAATIQTFWPVPVLYYFAQGGMALSGVYQPTHVAAGGGPFLSGTASVTATYSYLVLSGLAIGGKGHALLVTPARPRFRAVPADEPQHRPALPGNCLVYSRDGAKEGRRSAGAYIPKGLLAGRTLVARSDVADPSALPADAVIVEEC